MTAGSGFNVDSDISPSISRKKEFHDSARKNKDFIIKNRSTPTNSARARSKGPSTQA